MTNDNMPASTGALTRLLCGAAFGALICAAPTQAQEAPVLPATAYYNADGTTTADKAAAEASWRADPEFKANWSYDAINAEAAYARGLTGKGSKLGIIDTGTWAGHSEFAGDRLISIHIEGIRSIDDGYSPAKAGDAFSLDGGMPWFDEGAAVNHGMHVGGTIAANRDGKGMHGIAFGATLIAANGEGMGPVLGFIDALDPAIFVANLDAMVQAGARVVNGSWGIGSGNPIALSSQYYGAPTSHNIDAIEKAAQAGVVMVFSAGNNGNEAQPDAKGGVPHFRINPTTEQNFITVTNTGKDNILSVSSTICGYTKYWCVSAPGTGIYSSVVSGDDPDALKGGYGSKLGTSMAAPHVTGALGLLMERYGYLSSGQAADILKTTATDLGAKGVDATYGWGLIDLSKALEGPGQFLNRFDANLSAGTIDRWSNNISQEAVDQRQREEAAEVEALLATRTAKGWENGVTEAYRDTLVANLEPLRGAVEAPLWAYVKAVDAYKADPANFAALIKMGEAAWEISANPLAAEVLKKFEVAVPDLFTSTASAEQAFKTLLNNRDINSFLKDEDIFALAANPMFEAALLDYQALIGRLDPLSAKLSDPLGYDAGLTKSGAGMLILAGQNSYRGDTIVDGGDLVIDTGGSITSNAIVNDGGALSVFGTAADVRVNGGGWLAVGKAGVTADVTLDGGTALVNGNSGAVRVLDDGLLLGRGRIGSLAVLGGGIVAPGDPAGVLSVTGDASFAKDSQLAVGGQTTLDGGAVTLSGAGDEAGLISPEQALALIGQSEVILTSDAGVVGRFERAFPQYAFIGASLTYDPDAVRIGIARNDVAFADVANTANQRATGTGLESLGLGNTLHDLVLVTADPAHLAGDYDSLSGEMHASLAATIVSNNDYISGQMLKRLRSTGVPGAEQTSSNGLTLWGNLLAGFAQHDGTANTARLSSDTTGVISGFDKRWDNIQLGVAAAILDTKADIRRPGSSASDKGYYFGGYAGGTIGAVNLRAGANWASHTVKTQRSATLGAFSDSLSGRYKGDSWGAFGEAGLTIPMGTTNAEPYARIEYAAFTSDGFTEQGGIAALAGTAEQKRTAAFLGLRAATAPGKGPVQAEVDLAWRHSLGGKGALGRFAFAEGDRFIVNGIDTGKDAMIFGAGVNARLGSRVTLNLSYNGEMSPRYQSHSARAGLSYAF